MKIKYLFPLFILFLTACISYIAYVNIATKLKIDNSCVEKGGIVLYTNTNEAACVKSDAIIFKGYY